MMHPDPKSRRPRMVVAGLVLAGLSSAITTTASAGADEPVEQKTVQARQRLFGSGNVDPSTGQVRRDRAVFSWVTVSTVAASLGGQVVLLDSYIHKVEDRPNYVPATVQDLIDIDPKYIFIGHGHADHAENSGIIAVETGATVVGTPTHCDEAQRQADSYAPGAPPIHCITAVSNQSAPGEVINELPLLGSRGCVTALKHLHSDVESPDPEHDPNPVFLVPNPGPMLMHPPGPGITGGLFTNPGDEGSSVLYQFRIGQFTATWHDTVGPLKERAPAVLSKMRQLSPTDLQLGAILGTNVVTNGLRDPAMYVGALRPKVFAPLHHDFLTEYGSGDELQSTFEREEQVQNNAPDVRWLTDPYDYVEPGMLTFELDDPRWAQPRAEAGCQ